MWRLQLLGQSIKQIQTELAVSSAKGRGGGLQDGEALIASISVSMDKTRAHCMKAIEQVDAGIARSLRCRLRDNMLTCIAFWRRL